MSTYLYFIQIWLCYCCEWTIVMYFHILFKIASQALGQSHDCPSASEATLKDMGKVVWYPTTTKCIEA